MNSKDYRSTLGGVTPSPAWRARTLAAMEAAKPKKHSVRRPLAAAATAAALVIVVAGGVWLSGRTETDPNGPGVARTPEPVVTPTPIPGTSQAWNENFAIVTDPSQLMGKNPPAGRLDELTELPVYENPNIAASDEVEELMHTLAESIAQSLGLTSGSYTFEPGTDQPRLTLDCTDGTQIVLHGVNHRSILPGSDLAPLLDALRYDLQNNHSNKPLSLFEETLTTYNFDGTSHTTQTTFVSFPDLQSLSMQLYDYSFYRFTLENGVIRQAVPSTGTLEPPGKLVYPLRSEEDALASFRAGDYWGAHYTSHPEQAEILQVTIEYDTTEGQPYFQPVYRILYTQDYWDEVIAGWMFEGVDPTPFTGVGVAYIPAIDPKYQDEVPYRRYLNDGLAHHTPEELP